MVNYRHGATFADEIGDGRDPDHARRLKATQAEYLWRRDGVLGHQMLEPGRGGAEGS